MCDCEQLRKQEIVPEEQKCCQYCHAQNQLHKIILNEKQMLEICCDIALYLSKKKDNSIKLFFDNNQE